MNSLINSPFYKSEDDSVLAGVCGGIAKKMNIEPWIVRVTFVLGVLAVGLTPFLYLIFVFSFPQEDELHEAHEAKILGVCARFAKKMNWDVAIVRSVFASSLLLSLIPSFGTTLLIYFIMHFVLPDNEAVVSKNVVDVKAKDIN